MYDTQSKTALSEMIKMISIEHLSNSKNKVSKNTLKHGNILNTVKENLIICGLKLKLIPQEETEYFEVIHVSKKTDVLC